MYFERIHKAVVFATNAHTNQVRKTSNIPYITHPYTAALYVQPYLEESLSFTPLEKTNIVIAILLHDVIEDTPVTKEELEVLFGTNVTSLVIGASEADKSKTWLERKTETIEKVYTLPLAVRYVICADKIHNLTSMYDAKNLSGDDMWSTFKGDKKQQQWYFTKLYEALIHDSEPIPSFFLKMREQIDRVFGQ